MFNTTAPIKESGKGTIVYKNKWELFDQVIVSPGLLDDAGFHWKEGSSDRVDFPELLSQSPNSAVARPAGSYGFDGYQETGHSDHLPMSCVIEQ